MSDLEIDFQEDFREKYGDDELEEVEVLIEEAFDSHKSDYFHGSKWSLSSDVEKHHALQLTYYMHLSKETDGDDEKVSLEFESGISDGTQLRHYCLEGSSNMHDPNIVSVLDDLELDWDKVESKLTRETVTNIFNAIKPEIMDIYGKQNYDNYVTGGGTIKTDDHYENEFQEFHDRGFYWKCIYKDIEVDRSFV